MQLLVTGNNKALAMSSAITTSDNTLTVITTSLTFTDWQNAESNPQSTNPQEIAYNPTTQTLFSRDRSATSNETFWMAAQNYIANSTNDINNWSTLSASAKDSVLLHNTQTLKALLQYILNRK